MFGLKKYFFIITLQYIRDKEGLIITSSGTIETNNNSKKMYDDIFEKVCKEQNINETTANTIFYHISEYKI